ncbi:MAG: maleylpyruvate isomerase family mycothiol-dependent enzyme, partial [Williamsia herbipolensis]|nr:maleylpyruvate isomerase family mycothiol-dependent enzyme [Williamsia herbipolensis]
MTIDFDTHTREQSARFGEVLRDADPAARVPTCPDWNAGDLLYHLAEVHYFWATIVRDRITDEAVVDGEVEAAKPARPDDHGELSALYERTTSDLLEVLQAADDATPVWMWAPDESVGFVRRFQAHEALFHRVDAELAAGAEVTPLPEELAVDGIDVVLRMQKTWRPGWADWNVDGPIGRIETTDTGDDWTVAIGTWSGHSPDTGKTYDGEYALEVLDAGEPTFTIRGTAAAVDAWLWGRPG